MQHARITETKLLVLSSLLSLVAACSDVTAPTEPAPASQPEPAFDEELRVSGHVTSHFDETPIRDATIRVTASAPGPCDTWDVICGNSTWTVADTRSEMDGSFELTFSHPNCTPGRTVPITVEAFGFSSTELRAECRVEPQRLDVRLEPHPRLRLSVEPATRVAARPVWVAVNASSGAGLTSLHVDWGDGSAADAIEMSGKAHEVVLRHVYEAAGIFTVAMTVTDATGSGNRTLLRIQIAECRLQSGEPCEPLQSSDVSGSWTGAAYLLDTFTVGSGGPVEAVATVDGFDGEMRLVLLGFNATADTSRCSREWLPTQIPLGPAMGAPSLSARWSEVPAGTYCLNLVTAVAASTDPEPYSWTGTVTHP